MGYAVTSKLIASSDTPLIVGLGDTGLSCVRYFRRRDIPCSVVDSRAAPWLREVWRGPIDIRVLIVITNRPE